MVNQTVLIKGFDKFNSLVHCAFRSAVSVAAEVLNMFELTLRLLMSYIYIYMEHLFLMFLDHTQRRTTVGRTPLDE